MDATKPTLSADNLGLREAQPTIYSSEGAITVYHGGGYDHAYGQPCRAPSAMKGVWCQQNVVTIMGQPTNADLERRLIGIEAWLAAADVRRQANSNLGVTGRQMKGALETIDTRLSTLEAAFGIASSKGAEKLEEILHAVDALHIARGETLTDIVWGTRPWTATLKKGKKKHRRKA